MKISKSITILNCGQYELVDKENGPGLKKEVNFDASTSLGLESNKRIVSSDIW